MEDSALVKLIRRERVVTLAGIAALIFISWGYLVWMAYGMRTEVSSLISPSAVGWSVPYALMIFFMWAVMMVAMMTPSAAPMILTFARVNADRSESWAHKAFHAGLYAGVDRVQRGGHFGAVGSWRHGGPVSFYPCPMGILSPAWRHPLPTWRRSCQSLPWS